MNTLNPVSPIRGFIQAVVGACWLAWARWRRRRGLYDQRTLGLYWRAWVCADGRPAALLALARFRRDLGRPLPRRWQPALQDALRADPPGLRGADRAWARLLLDDVAGLDGEMAARRRAFAAWSEAQRRAGGVCVVGNAAGLAGAGLGPSIDGHAGVVRFNQWRDAQTAVADVGDRCAVWVLSPGCRGPLQAVPPWVVFSGADPQHRLPGWPLAEAVRAAGAVTLTVPLPIWRALVARLQAPPSAGLLMLAWLHALAGWDGIRIAAIGWGSGPTGRHHLVQSNRQTGSRHRWQREREIVDEWRNAGLRDLGPAVPGLPPAPIS